MKYIIISLINLYQRTFSPDHGFIKHKYPYGFCKFYPSCSEFAKMSVNEHGILGLIPALKRILRCNPFSKGGIDLPHAGVKK